MELESLKAQVKALEAENNYLKRLLKNAGIDYASADTTALSDAVSQQGVRIFSEEITRNHARQFFSFFWGRTDVYSKRSQNKTTGKSGYYPQCDNFWHKGICPKVTGGKVKCKDCVNRCWTALNGTEIENHLKGIKED